jgi:hypothetical protein
MRDLVLFGNSAVAWVLLYLLLRRPYVLLFPPPAGMSRTLAQLRDLWRARYPHLYWIVPPPPSKRPLGWPELIIRMALFVALLAG